MSIHKRFGATWLLLALVVAGCASQPGSPASTAGSSAPQQGAAPSGPKRIVAAVKGDGHTLSELINNVGGASVIGVDEVEHLLNAGMVMTDDHGNLQPQLAEQVPTLDNGLWKLLPDGTMTTTLTIKPGVMWHDGAPFTSADLVFSYQVAADREIGTFKAPSLDSISGVEAVDDRTVVVHWKSSYIDADQTFSQAASQPAIQPMPKHLLEQAYLSDKPNFTAQSFWSSGYIGTGAFRLKEWDMSNHVLLDANPDFIMGRPKVDQVEVKFINDTSALFANILAGAVEMTMNRGLSLEQGVQLQNQWNGGRLEQKATGQLVIYPQFIDPQPSVVGDVRFRRAMVQAMDRQGMVDTLMQGQSTVAESFLNPGFAGHDIVDPYIVHYPYDQRAAQQAIASLGYTRGSDGIFRGADGQPLSLELRVAAGDDLNQKATLSVANDWKNAGVDVQPAIIPGSRVTDLEYTATFPAFTFTRFKNDLSRLNKFGTKNTPLPANNYRITGNTPRYMDPAFDALLDRYFVTIPKQDRMQLVGQIIHTMTDQVIQMTLFFVTEPTVLSNRLVNVEGAREGVSMTWNAEKWDVKS